MRKECRDRLHYSGVLQLPACIIWKEAIRHCALKSMFAIITVLALLLHPALCGP
jgi:hypothetical protein